MKCFLQFTLNILGIITTFLFRNHRRRCRRCRRCRHCRPRRRSQPTSCTELISCSWWPF